MSFLGLGSKQLDRIECPLMAESSRSLTVNMQGAAYNSMRGAEACLRYVDRLLFRIFRRFRAEALYVTRL